MGFGQGAYAKIWNLEDKGNYHVAEMSISAKNEKGQYETVWSNKYVRLYSTAHEQAYSLDISKKVKIGSCRTRNKYDKDKEKESTYYKIFNFEDVDSGTTEKKKTASKAAKKETPVIDEDDEDRLPFG